MPNSLKNPFMTRFTDQIALVTGASRGLGFHTARLLAAEGAHVYALARTVGALEELDDTIREAGHKRPTLCPLDITDDEGVERLGATLFERHGKLDLFIHAAIHAPPLSPVGHIKLKDLEQAMAINAQAVPRLIRSLDPLLSQSAAPRAVFFTDEKGDTPFWSSYSTPKEAGLSFARIWAQERASTSLKILFDAPPPMRTALRARFFPGESKEELAEPGDVAAALLDKIAAA